MNRQQQGRDTTSDDYYSYVARMDRTRSIAADLPHYPNVHLALQNRAAAGTTSQEEDQARGGSQKNDNQQKRPEVSQPPKKVQFAEQTTAEVDKNGDRCEEVSEKRTPWTVDGAADAFIRQKRKSLELCKWATFKVS